MKTKYLKDYRKIKNKTKTKKKPNNHLQKGLNIMYRRIYNNNKDKNKT